jgi:hypothetical protein
VNEDTLDEAAEALKATPIPPGPPADTLARLRERLAQAAAPVPSRWRLLACLACGSLAAALAGLLIVLGANRAAAFDAALAMVEEAGAVRFEVTMTLGAATLPKNVVTAQGNKCRVEGIGGGLTWILDRDKGVALITAAQSKKFQQVDISKGFIAPSEVVGMNVREQLLALKGQRPEAAGAETLDGVLADRFVAKAGKAFHTQGEWTLWVARKSGLPVRVSVSALDNGRPMTRVFSGFDWAPAIDAATFNTDPPEGYKEGVVLRIFPELPPLKKRP